MCWQMTARNCGAVYPVCAGSCLLSHVAVAGLCLLQKEFHEKSCQLIPEKGSKEVQGEWSSVSIGVERGVAAGAGGMTTLALRWYHDREAVTGGKLATVGVAATESFALATIGANLGGTFAPAAAVVAVAAVATAAREAIHKCSDDGTGGSHRDWKDIATDAGCSLLSGGAQAAAVVGTGASAVVGGGVVMAVGVATDMVRTGVDYGRGRISGDEAAVKTASSLAVLGTGTCVSMGTTAMLASFGVTTAGGIAAGLTAAALPAIAFAVTGYYVGKYVKRGLMAVQAMWRYKKLARALGVSPDASEVDAKSAYRRATRRCHPDRGGTAEAFVALTEQYAELFRYRIALGLSSEDDTSEAAARLSPTKKFPSYALYVLGWLELAKQSVDTWWVLEQEMAVVEPDSPQLRQWQRECLAVADAMLRQREEQQRQQQQAVDPAAGAGAPAVAVDVPVGV